MTISNCTMSTKPQSNNDLSLVLMLVAGIVVAILHLLITRFESPGVSAKLISPAMAGVLVYYVIQTIHYRLGGDVKREH